MIDDAATGMRDLAAYAPIRVALTGIWRIVFGLALAVPGALFIYLGPHGEPGAPRAAGDMPPWWMFLVGIALFVGALQFIAGGVGRILSAFQGDCYFRAGPAGIAIRLPRQGWFGRFRMVEHRVAWDDVEQFVHFTHRLNGIPVSRELRIHVRGGKPIAIERFYFSASIRSLQEQLITLGAVSAG